MNRERMIKVAEAIERDAAQCKAKHFNMCSYGVPEELAEFAKGGFGDPNSCHTAGCIAGWCNALRFIEDGTRPPASSDIDMPAWYAAEWLELSNTSEEYGILFLPNMLHDGVDYLIDDPNEPGYIDAKHAAAMLRYCAEKGDVQPHYWRECLPS